MRAVEAGPSLFKANMAAFEHHHHLVYLRLAEIEYPQTAITGSVDTRDLNLDLGHAQLYSPDAVTFTESQLATFRAQPTRFYMKPPALRDPPVQHQHYIAAALYDYVGRRKMSATPDRPVEEGGFLLVYGIGLGWHLPTLFEELNVRHFILVEEHLEFLYQSLHLLDWAGMLDRLDERGQTLQFVFGSEPRQVAGHVHWFMRGQGFGLIDGSYIYRHYSSMMLDKACQEFAESQSLLPISIGFFEDEQIMLDNCGTNMIWFDFYMLQEKRRLEIDLPAIIVGSGPSLDTSIEHIRRLQDRAVIFSCGSALRPLIKAGIRPDFHCELENGWESFRAIWNLVQDTGRDLDDITLIASSTAHRCMMPLFTKRIFYFRDSVSSTALWSPDRTGIFGTAPTCTNLALRAATILCFKQLYLFGVDLGTRDPSQHHAIDTIYHHDPFWQEELAKKNSVNAMNIEMPGNFGGKAYTSQVLHWARMMMTQSIDAFSFAKIYNCSDGVAIPGVPPCLPGSIRVASPPGRKAMVLARIMRDLDYKAKREMVPLDQLTVVRAAFGAYYDRMVATIDAAAENGTPFRAFYEQMDEYLREEGADPFQAVLRAVNVGTLMMSFQIAYYFVRRVPESEAPSVMAIYLKVLRERVMLMKGELDGIFKRIENAHAFDRKSFDIFGREYAI